MIGFIKNYIENGHKVLVEGRIKYEKWEDENGITRYSTKIVADQIQGLSFNGEKREYEEAETDPEYDDDSVPF